MLSVSGDIESRVMIDENDLIRRACKAMGVTLEELRRTGKGAARTTLSNKRAVVAWALREAGLSTYEIGEKLNRDHSTIHYLVTKISKDPELLTHASHIYDMVIKLPWEVSR